MLLQTDPTVIYGLGASFDGNLKKRDLLADTPYNTYTRTGLLPTPIALPGTAALRAALNPPATDYLYFVARRRLQRVLPQSRRTQPGRGPLHPETQPVKSRFITF